MTVTDQVVETLDDLQRVLSLCEYPGMMFTVESQASALEPYDAFSPYELWVRFERAVSDSLNPAMQVRVIHRRPVMKGMPTSAIVRWLFLQIVEIHRHEAGELFQFHGERRFWPHPRHPTKEMT
ncbi:MAG: hypothetical protein ABSD03_09375 [Vulcanimicrobiaceae bacterium]|jgi:hypothetical protein